MFRDQRGEGELAVTALLIVAAVIVIGALAWGCPQYNVYTQEMEGTANLRKAEQTRQILVEQAQAELDAAELRSRAIEIMGGAAQKYPEYRLQEFMGAFAEALQNGSIEKIVFVPTEANIPILEAGRTAND